MLLHPYCPNWAFLGDMDFSEGISINVIQTKKDKILNASGTNEGSTWLNHYQGQKGRCIRICPGSTGCSTHSDLRHLLLEQEHQILHPPSSPQEATLLQRAEPTPIYTTPVSLKRAPSSPSDYQVNKTYLRRSRCVSSEWKQIPRSSHAILRQTCVSFEKVFRLQLSWAPSNSDCNTQQWLQYPRHADTESLPTVQIWLKGRFVSAPLEFTLN